MLLSFQTDNPIVVGMNPSKVKPGKNSTLTRLERWMDYLGYRYYGFTNVHWKESWDGNKNDVDLLTLKNTVRGHGTVIALGKLPSDVLTAIGVNHFMLPHPSPRNLQTNDKEFISRRLEACYKYTHNVSYSVTPSQSILT